MAHVRRPELSRNHPVHVTVRFDEGVPSLRSRRIYPVVREALSKVNAALGMQIAQDSVQREHIHMIVEAEDRASLARGMQGLCIRLAKAINRAMGRKRGHVFRDRYHADVLKTPRQVRNALGYVLNNLRKHLKQVGIEQYGRSEVDELSSAPWFDGWCRRVKHPCTGPPPHPRPRTWLLRVGWRRHGLLDPAYVPSV